MPTVAAADLRIRDLDGLLDRGHDIAHPALARIIAPGHPITRDVNTDHLRTTGHRADTRAPDLGHRTRSTTDHVLLTTGITVVRPTRGILRSLLGNILL